MLLRYIGMKWSVHLKAALATFQSSPNVWKSYSIPVSALDIERRLYFLGPTRLIAQPELTVESIRAKHFREEVFLEQLAERVDEQRGSYGDDVNEVGDTRKSSLQVTQSLLHTLRTEMIIKKGLCQDITVLRTDFSSFGPSLPHLTITTVLEALGMSDKWVEFFRRTLEAPVKFIEDCPDPIVQIRRRGTLPSSPMSDFMAEAVLFCLDFTVNKETSCARMYHLHDNIWLWGSEKSCTKAWDVMINNAKLTGLGFNREKTSCVEIAKPGDVVVPPNYSSLPEGDITWGFLKLDGSSGRFIVDQNLVNKHVKELRPQLEACKSVIDYLQAWNVYGVLFFVNNIGQPANCFGVAHVQMMLETFHGIQSQLFGSKDHSADTLADIGAANDITSVLQQMILSRFGVKVPEGYLYFPTFLGGLDLKNLFVTLGMIHDNIEFNPDAFMRSFFKEERADYERAKKFFETVTVPLRAQQSKEVLEKDRFSHEPFMNFAEYTRYREQTSTPLYRVYKRLMREPAEQVVLKTPEVNRALGDRNVWEEVLSAYEKRVVEMHADDIISRFGGLHIVQKGWLPTGMVSMFRESRFQWKD
ncbi:hypothetical protein IFR05_001934 [Cadophora sp. M221]|nr:hypothetical protein IFR05_001934 [Cadophora sp. M221]